MYIETKQQTELRLRIVDAIEEVTGVPRELWEIRRTRSKEEVMIRHIYINMLYNTKQFTLKTIAKIVGLKNHCTILQSIDRVKSWQDSDEFDAERTLYNYIKEEYEQRNS